MQILFINTTFGYVGGVEQHIVLAADGLTKLGHTCSIVFHNPSGRAVEEFSTHFQAFYSLDSQTWEDVLAAAAPSCIYIHKWESIEPILNAVQGKIPILRYFHDHDIYCPRRHKYLVYSRKICTHKAGLACYFDLAFLERRNGAMAIAPIEPKLKELHRNKTLDCVVVGSSYMKHELIRNGFPISAIEVIPPAVSDFSKPPVPLKHEGKLLYVGQLVRGKGVDILLRALAMTNLGQTLQIIGTGNDEQHLKSLTKKLGLDTRVQFLGWRPHHELADFYDDADIVVVPSRWPEPFGMVGLEALLRQRPVIASKVGGIPDWLDDGETGVLFPVNDEASLAKAIERLTMDTALATEMGIQGRVQILARFSFDAFITKLANLMQQRIG